VSLLQRPVSPLWAAIVLAAGIGWVAGARTGWLTLTAPAEAEVWRMPAPWRIPHLPGMGTLRLVMVHDVLHERFVTRSAAWYTARNAVRRASITAWEADGGAPTPDILADFDDLAVGHERLGDSAAAVTVMRRKAALIGLQTPQRPQALPGVADASEQARIDLDAWRARGTLSETDHHRYTTLANLGTSLIHGKMRSMLDGEAEARSRVEEGLACLQEAVRINPAAHLGRETWQIVAVEHLLAVARDPGLRLRFDLVGDALAAGPAPPPSTAIRGHLTAALWLHRSIRDTSGLPPRVLGHDSRFGTDWTPEMLDALLTDQGRLQLRDSLATVGADPDWVAAVGPSRLAPAAFDQPLLGVLGMWMFGGGANPHSALTVATICERIGQRRLAAEAYERCIGLSGRDRTGEALIAHCQARQAVLAAALAPEDPVAWLTRLRHDHSQELAAAMARRTALHAAEAALLATGMAPDDPALDPAVLLGDPPLASDPGNADERWSVPDQQGLRGDGLVCAILAAAAVAWLGILGQTLIARRTTA
jgi:hypothetical protein